MDRWTKLRTRRLTIIEMPILSRLSWGSKAQASRNGTKGSQDTGRTDPRAVKVSLQKAAACPLWTAAAETAPSTDVNKTEVAPFTPQAKVNSTGIKTQT